MFPPSIQSLIEKLRTQLDWSPGDVVRLIREAKITPEMLSPWGDLEHDPRDGYGRKLVHKDPHFEIMVMSWRPGDFAAIHDHGYATWGAVQIFGPAEHATFRVTDGHLSTPSLSTLSLSTLSLSTLRRWIVEPGDIIGVSHSLVHQMGNPTKDENFVSLHIYGCAKARTEITGEARIYDLENDIIQRVNGGVFFELPKAQVVLAEPGPTGDFPTRLRHMVEVLRRLDVIADGAEPNERSKQAYDDAFSLRHRDTLLRCLDQNTDSRGHQNNSVYWRTLAWETAAAAKYQESKDPSQGEDDFGTYAEVYDALVGESCMTGFMRDYLRFVFKEHNIDLSSRSIISLGCGTGLVERFMIDSLGAQRDRLKGIDYSKGMVQVAAQYINAEHGDILGLDDHEKYDLAYSGLNVFHYLPIASLPEAISRAASVVKDGGHFVADFITPDHIRNYPNVVYSKDRNVISLRTPCLAHKSGRMFQRSEITNISFLGSEMRISYAGVHQRSLPPVGRIREYLKHAFGAAPTFYDAHSLEILPEGADTCESTRYVAVVQKRTL